MSRKSTIFDREQDDKYVSVELRISEELVDRAYDLADLFKGINKKTEWQEPTRILEWALFTGMFEMVFEIFEMMNDNGEITEKQFKAFLEDWHKSDRATQIDSVEWGPYAAE